MSIFTETQTKRLKRLINEEKDNLRRAEKKLLAGSLSFTLQEVHQGKQDIMDIKGRIRVLQGQLAREEAK